MKVVLYSTGCPKCHILETKLKQKNIDFILVNDIELMVAKGFDLMPVLEVDGEIMDFVQANNWINNMEV